MKLSISDRSVARGCYLQTVPSSYSRVNSMIFSVFQIKFYYVCHYAPFLIIVFQSYLDNKTDLSLYFNNCEKE